MMYEIVFDELVIEKDFKSISLPDRKKIIRAVKNKLAADPERYGEPLRGDLKGFWKLRVGEFRVIYSIEKKRILVYVAVIGFRRDDEVYKTSLTRLDIK